MVGSLEFFIVMAVLYAVECVRRVGPDELILDTRICSGFRVKRAAPFPNGARWGWVFLNPLRPDSPTFSLMPAVCVLADSANTPGEEAFSQNLDPTRFDLDRINETYAAMRRSTAWICRSSLSLLLLCLGLFPACVSIFGLRAALVPATVAILLISISIAALYCRNRKVVAPGITTLDLYANAARFALYPLSAIRCMDLLSRNYLATSDPIAVATALCGHNEAARLAAAELVMLRFSVTPPELDDAARAMIAEYKRARLQLVESFVEDQGLGVDELMDPPIRTDEVCETYCPACRTQFRLPVGHCPDCPNILLQPLRQPARQEVLGPQKEEADA